MNFEVMFFIPFLRHLALVWDAIEKYEVAEHAAKNAWRERVGWCSDVEAEITLSGKDGAHFEIIMDE